MWNKVFFVVVPIFAIIAGVVLNFQEMLMSSPATIKNVMVTFAYLAIWACILIITLKTNNHNATKYYLVFWLLTLFFAALTGFVNVTEVHGDWAIPFIALLLTPWYGIERFVDNFLITSIIIASLSLVMFIAFLFTLKGYRSI